MQLSDIQADARYMVFGNSSNTQYADTDLNRNINEWYKRAIAMILRSNGEWQVEGEIATTDIETNQREYILPTNILKLNEVYIKTTTAGDWVKAEQIDTKEIKFEPDEDYNPVRPEFDLLDNSLFIYIPETSITAVTDGIKIHYQNEITEMSGSTDEPNLANPFRRYLSMGAAHDYLLANDKVQKAREFERMLREQEEELVNFYATRSTVRMQRLQRKKDKYA